MPQNSWPVPASVPSCGEGHRPQYVRTTGAPAGHRLGHPCPATLHIECHRCGLATIPVPEGSFGMAELRWTREDLTAMRIPISHLVRHRAEVLASLPSQAA